MRDGKIDYCIIGGMAINAYCEPMVTLDIDCAIVMEHISMLKQELKERGFSVKTHPHTWEITHRESNLKIQIQRDERYQAFIGNAERLSILGYDAKVARKEDVLLGKIWAYSDPERNALKREKDLLDIKRLVQKHPKLKKLVPKKI